MDSVIVPTSKRISKFNDVMLYVWHMCHSLATLYQTEESYVLTMRRRKFVVKLNKKTLNSMILY